MLGVAISHISPQVRDNSINLGIILSISVVQKDENKSTITTTHEVMDKT